MLLIYLLLSVRDAIMWLWDLGERVEGCIQTLLEFWCDISHKFCVCKFKNCRVNSTIYFVQLFKGEKKFQKYLNWAP
jgi:hypothetical protein